MKSQKAIFVVLIILLDCLLCYEAVIAQKGNWPQFRGPNCSGIATKNAIPPIELNEKTLQWKTALPVGHSSPCIWGDNLFLTAFAKEKSELQTICIDRHSGAIKWLKTLHPDTIEKHHQISNPAVTTPVTDGKIVCVYFGSHGLLCYDFQGNLLWEFVTPKSTGREGIATSPIFAGEIVIFIYPYGADPHILALQRTNGATLWKTSLPQVLIYGAFNHSTPIVLGEQVILHRMGEIVSHSINDGKRLWWVLAPTKGVSTPIIGENKLFVCTWNNFGEQEMRVKLPDFQSLIKEHDKNSDGFIAQNEVPANMIIATRPEIKEMKYANVSLRLALSFMDDNDDKLIDEIEWVKGKELFASLCEDHGMLAIRPDGTGDVTLSNTLWKEIEKVPEVPSPVYFGGRVYMVKNGGIITCMQASTGHILYRERLGASGAYIASPIVANNKIFIPSLKGVITVISDGDELDILAQNDLGEKIFATPAVIGNTLYVRTTEHLYAFAK
jgi:outer membrane protein assembly factor BamB